MARNMYAKPTTTNASFMKVPVNLSAAENTSLTWGQLIQKLPILTTEGSVPIKAIKLGAITVGGSPDAPAHVEFKGGQTFDLPALATKPMRVKPSEKNLYASGWRRVTYESNTLKVFSNTDDDDLTNSVVFTYRGQVAYIEVALRFYDDEGYRPWYTGGDLPPGPFESYFVPTKTVVAADLKVYAFRTVIVYTDSNVIVVGDEIVLSSTSEAESLTPATGAGMKYLQVAGSAIAGTYGEVQYFSNPYDVKSAALSALQRRSVGTDSIGVYASYS